MQIELRDFDLEATERLAPEVLQTAIGPALARFEDRVRRVRVRFLPNGSFDTTCRVRVWCGRGQTLIVEEHGRSKIEAAYAVADTLKRSLHQRWSRERDRSRRSEASSRAGQQALS